MSPSKKIFIISQILALAYVLIFFGPNLNADFWLIDDHEILKNLFKLQNGNSIWDLILNSEVGHWGTALRYRPAYYLLNSIETLLWGQNTTAWYAIRLLAFQQFIALVFYISSRKFHILLTSTLTLWIFSQVYWSDIFSRLGTGEAYAVVGCCFILYAYSIEQKNLFKTSAILACIGLFIAAGVKENIASIILILSCYSLFAHSHSQFRKIILGLVSLYCLFILLGVYLATKNSGMDVLGQSSNLQDRIILLVLSLKKQVILVSLVCLALMTYIYKKNIRSLFANKDWFFVFTSVVILMINYAFYSGKWPTKMRYDFPGLLFTPLSIGVTLQAAIVFWRVPARYQKAFYIIFFLATLVFSVPKLQTIRTESKNNLARTKETTEFFNRVESHIVHSPQKLIVLEIQNPTESYEFLYSTRAFLKARGLNNDVQPRLQISKETFPTTSLDYILSKTLEKEQVVTAQITDCLSVSVNKKIPVICQASEVIFPSR